MSCKIIISGTGWNKLFKLLFDEFRIAMFVRKDISEEGVCFIYSASKRRRVVVKNLSGSTLLRDSVQTLDPTSKNWI